MLLLKVQPGRALDHLPTSTIFNLILATANLPTFASFFVREKQRELESKLYCSQIGHVESLVYSKFLSEADANNFLCDFLLFQKVMLLKTTIHLLAAGLLFTTKILFFFLKHIPELIPNIWWELVCKTTKQF